MDMATKNGSSQDYKGLLKEIRKIVREEVENEVSATKEDLDSTIRESRMQVQEDIREVGDRMKNLEIRVTKNHREVKEEIKKGHIYPLNT